MKDKIRKWNCTVCGSPVYLTYVTFDTVCIHCNCGDVIRDASRVEMDNWEFKA